MGRITRFPVLRPSSNSPGHRLRATLWITWSGGEKSVLTIRGGSFLLTKDLERTRLTEWLDVHLLFWHLTDSMMS